MVNQQLIEWIKNEEAKGYTPQQLYNSLIRQGYNPNEINEAMKIASQPISQINHSAEQIKNSFNLLPIILISIVIIGIIGGGIIFFMSQNNETNSEIIHRTIESTSNITNSKGNQVGEMNTKIEADIEITTDCGDMDCFEQKFAECKSATTTSKLMDNIVYFYEIIGLKDGLCEVKSKFTANPNPEWVEKEMICKYDNTKDFETAVQNLGDCQGELYDLITGSSEDSESITENINLNKNELFLNAKPCTSSGDCSNQLCFENYCVEPTDTLKEYIYNKYSQPPCGQLCEGCSAINFFDGKTYESTIGFNDFQIRICKDCDKDISCKEGYKCEPYKCVAK